MTRSHIIYDHAEEDPTIGGLISIVGGKLTTYRNLARQTVDEVYDKLGLHPPRSRTAAVPLPGGATEDFSTFAAEFKATSGLADELAERLLRLYGVRAPDVLAEAGDDPSLRLSLSPSATAETGVIGAEILYAFRREMAQTLSDALLRRTMVGMGPRVALDVDRAAADIAVELLGWDRQRAGREVQDFREYIRRYKPKQLRESTPTSA